MAIVRGTNPVDDAEIVMITGKIDRIIIKEAEKTSKNLEYGVTHLASLLIDGVYINYISIPVLKKVVSLISQLTKEARTSEVGTNSGN